MNLALLPNYVLAMLPDYGRCTKLKQNSYNEFQQSNSAASVDSTCNIATNVTMTLRPLSLT